MFEKIKNLKLFSNFKFQISNFLEYGFYLFIFLLPWQTHLIIRPGEWHGKFGGNWPVDYWRIALYGTDILLVLLLFLAGFIRLRSGKNLIMAKKSWLWIFLACLDLTLFISIVFAPDKALAAYKYLSFLFGLSLFWLASSDFYNKSKALLAFFSSLAIQGLLALGQFFNQGSPAFKWLGLASHNATDPGASVIETLGADGRLERWLRAYGSFDHPNVLGGFLALGLIFLFYIISKHQRSVNKKIDFKFTAYCLLLVICLAGLLFSFSRSAALAAVAGIVLVAGSLFWRRDKNGLKRFFKALVLAAAISAAMFFSYADVFLARTSPQARLEIKSINERQLYLQDSFSLIKKSNFLGVGIGNYSKALEIAAPQRFYWQWQPVHNVFLLILVEGGIFALISFGAFIISLFYFSYRQKNIFNLSILLSLGIIMMLDHYLWSLHFGQLLFWLMAGVTTRNFLNNKEYDN